MEMIAGIFMKKKNIILFKNGNMELKVNLDKETVWLTQSEIAELYDTERSVITKHLNNIFKDEELNKNSVCAIFAHTASDGKTYNTNYYNLDAILSVGYRVNSKKATRFRIWSTRILKEHLLEGYTINKKRLEYLEKTVKLIDIANRGNKRIAATLFIYFLFYYDILYKEDKQIIDNNTLTALTLLIAESNPKEKEIIIDLVMNFLNN